MTKKTLTRRSNPKSLCSNIFKYISNNNLSGTIISPKEVTNEDVKCAINFVNGYFCEEDISKTINYLYYITRNGKMYINNKGKYLWERKCDAVLSYKASIRHSIMALLELTIPADSDKINQIYMENFNSFEIHKIKIEKNNEC